MYLGKALGTAELRTSHVINHGSHEISQSQESRTLRPHETMRISETNMYIDLTTTMVSMAVFNVSTQVAIYSCKLPATNNHVRSLMCSPSTCI